MKLCIIWGQCQPTSCLFSGKQCSFVKRESVCYPCWSTCGGVERDSGWRRCLCIAQALCLTRGERQSTYWIEKNTGWLLFREITDKSWSDSHSSVLPFLFLSSHRVLQSSRSIHNSWSPWSPSLSLLLHPQTTMDTVGSFEISSSHACCCIGSREDTVSCSRGDCSCVNHK